MYIPPLLARNTLDRLVLHQRRDGGKDGSGYLIKKNDKYCQPAFASAILKYGWNNFEHEIVANNLTKEEADDFEKLLIKKLNTMKAKTF